MFRPSVTGFIDALPELYPSTALDPPPTPPRSPFFEALDVSGASGGGAPSLSYTGPLNDSSAAYHHFRDSPEFLQTHEQWLLRLNECRDFAHTHFTRVDAEWICDHLEHFRIKLQRRYGEDFAGDRMPLLYGEAKRCMDLVCQRLWRNDIPLEVRKSVLKDLSSALVTCLSTGAAFITAAHALDLEQGGLHGHYLEAFQQRQDALLREWVAQDTALGPPNQQWRNNMEVHAVNRLRLEFGLYGADRDDPFVQSPSLVTPASLPECLQLLKQQLRPVHVVRRLAERYREQLMDRLPEAIQSAPADADLSSHYADLTDAIGHLNASYGEVHPKSLLEINEETGQCRWRADLSLLILDLLRSLEAVHRVNRWQPVVVATGESAEGRWQLEQVDGRLFYVVEHCPAAAPPDATSARLRHAQGWQAQHPGQTMPPDLVRTLLVSEAPDALMELPLAWLTAEDQMVQFLRRLGMERASAWLTGQRWNREKFRLILPALTDLGMAPLLEQLFKTHSLRLDEWLFLGGGGRILHRAVAQACPETLRQWGIVFSGTVHVLTIDTVREMFSPTGGASLLSRALMHGGSEHIRILMVLLEAAGAAGKVLWSHVQPHLQCDIQRAMRLGRVDALAQLGRELRIIATSVWSGAIHLPPLIEGVVPGLGCHAALEYGQTAVVHGFFDLLQTLHGDGLLRIQDIEPMVRCVAVNLPPGAYCAVFNGHADTLEAYLNRMIGASEAVLIPSGVLTQSLMCGDDDAGLLHMLRHHPDNRCLLVWRQAVADARARSQLWRDGIETLITGNQTFGHPVLGQLLQPHDEPALAAWLDLVKWLKDQAVVSAFQVEQLLAPNVSPHLGSRRPLLHAQMASTSSPQMIEPCIRFYFRAQREGLIPTDSLERLLMSAAATTPPQTALNVAVRASHHACIQVYLDTVLHHAQERPLSSLSLLRILDGRSGEDTLSTVVAVEQGSPDMLHMLLNAALRALQTNLINAEDWREHLGFLLSAQVSLDARAQRALPEIRELLHNTLRVSRGLGLLTQPDIERLDPLVSQAFAPTRLRLNPSSSIFALQFRRA
jgi:hypothetical protein